MQALSRAIAAAVQQGGEVGVGQARVVLLGEGGAGKTSLARALLNKPFVDQHISTAGADVFSIEV